MISELINQQYSEKGLNTLPSKLCANLDELYVPKKLGSEVKYDKSLLELQISTNAGKRNDFSFDKQKKTSENIKLYNRLEELAMERNELDKQKNSSAIVRNLIYPFAMLLLLVLTSITVLLVMQNTIELLIGIKALPLSSRVRFF